VSGNADQLLLELLRRAYDSTGDHVESANCSI
jgi:hypothetical protein